MHEYYSLDILSMSVEYFNQKLEYFYQKNRAVVTVLFFG